MPDKNSKLISTTSQKEIEDIYTFFLNPANMPLVQVASDKTHYAWQHLSNYFRTEQILRDGPISELREKLNPAIGKIAVTFADGTEKNIEDYFNASTMDAMVVLHKGEVVYEKYKTIRRSVYDIKTKLF